MITAILLSIGCIIMIYGLSILSYLFFVGILWNVCVLYIIEKFDLWDNPNDPSPDMKKVAEILSKYK